MRKRWTDERLDGPRVEEGDAVLEKLEARFDGTERLVIQVGSSIIATTVVCAITSHL